LLAAIGGWRRRGSHPYRARRTRQDRTGDQQSCNYTHTQSSQLKLAALDLAACSLRFKSKMESVR
jgi:hypothetical protein